MWERIINCIAVYLGSMFKFIIGPLTGAARDLSFIETVIFTSLGMMTTVFLISLMSDEFRHKLIWRLKRDKRLFTRRNRQIVRLWNRFGLEGIAFLTPVLLMPIGGALIAMSFGGSRIRMYKYMFVSSVFWSLITCFAVRQVGSLVHSII
jgi:hypothetical protein